MMTAKQSIQSSEASPASGHRHESDMKSITPIRAIAMILAYGVVRLHQRQKSLDNSTEESVHHDVLPTKGETP